MGVSGSGKSSVLGPLATRLGAITAEGDTFHPQRNIDRMRSGVALTDADRLPWLQAIADWIGAREAESVDAVVTCSALRRRYRDQLREGHPSVRFVHLTVARSELERRLKTRTGHYMPASLLPSQLATLEPLATDEPGISVVADASPDQLAATIASRLTSEGRRT